MTTQDFKRKLTAVFSADVAGYSRLMGDNEAETVRTLETYKEIMFSLISGLGHTGDRRGGEKEVGTLKAPGSPSLYS